MSIRLIQIKFICLIFFRYKSPRIQRDQAKGWVLTSYFLDVVGHVPCVWGHASDDKVNSDRSVSNHRLLHIEVLVIVKARHREYNYVLIAI